LRNLALGIAAFEHAPADLPDGVLLFPQQEDAAIALLSPQVLQMDTGEGKTYALLPAAFALACKYGRAYILCANDYLAWRDANRTRRYWEYVGLPVGLGLSGQVDSEWANRVVYTTPAGLAFKFLRVQSLLASLGMEEGEVIENRLISRNIRLAQIRSRQVRIIRNLGQIYVDDANELILAAIRNWLEYHQIPAHDGDPTACPRAGGVSGRGGPPGDSPGNSARWAASYTAT